jgi:hypothetical protein
MRYPLQLNSVVSPISTILICGVLITTLIVGGSPGGRGGGLMETSKRVFYVDNEFLFFNIAV